MIKQRKIFYSVALLIVLILVGTELYILFGDRMRMWGLGEEEYTTSDWEPVMEQDESEGYALSEYPTISLASHNGVMGLLYGGDFRPYDSEDVVSLSPSDIESLTITEELVFDSEFLNARWVFEGEKAKAVLFGAFAASWDERTTWDGSRLFRYDLTTNHLSEVFSDSIDSRFTIPLIDSISPAGDLIGMKILNCWGCEALVEQGFVIDTQQKLYQFLEPFVVFEWLPNRGFRYKKLIYTECAPNRDEMGACYEDPETLPWIVGDWSKGSAYFYR